MILNQCKSRPETVIAILAISQYCPWQLGILFTKIGRNALKSAEGLELIAVLWGVTSHVDSRN